MTKKCISCGKEIESKSVIFKCPACDREIARCGHCRKLTVSFKCDCGFEGP